MTTARKELSAKLGLLAFVLVFVVFFSRPQGQFRAVALGDAVPDFTLRRDDGQAVALQDYRGKVVVLNFWASWCGPCVDELPSLMHFAERYKDKDVQVIGVSLDEDPDAYVEFLAAHQINFLTLRDPSHRVAESYGTFKLPETYIISGQGTLLNKIVGAADWSSQQFSTYMDSLLASSS
jgi:peroxiredoxin